MLRSILAFSFLATTFALAACGDEGSNTTGGSPSSSSTGTSGVTAAEACSALAKAACGKIQSCSPFLLDLSYGSLATCEERVALACPTSFTAEGSTTMPGDTKACADALADTSCEDIFVRNTPAACDPKPGTLADGQACGQDSQCSSKQCNKQGDLCGVCAAHVAAGAACKDNEDCEPGLNCTADKCVAPAAEGESCGQGTPCQASLACVSAKCVKTVGAGEQCDVTAPNCDTLQGLGCNMMGVCQQIKFAAPGEGCGLQGTDYVACKGGSFCKTDMGGTSGTCLAPAADGAACDETNGPHCTAGAICSGSVCKLNDGSSCN